MADTNFDPFEEFEFKPINEGLGFHNKKSADKSAAKQQASSMSSDLLTEVPLKSKTELTGRPKNQASIQPEVRFEAPLPRPEAKRKAIEVPTIQDDSVLKSQNSVNEILKTLNQKRHLDFEQTTETKKTELKKSKPQLFAAFLDSMLITAAFLLSLIVMLSVTKTDLFMSLTHPESSNSIFVATAALFSTVYFIYMVINRAFVGYTPGEWAYDQICGTPKQTSEYTYVLKVSLRSLIVMATGFVLLPIISYLFNKDIAGEVSGVSLFQKPMGSSSH